MEDIVEGEVVETSMVETKASVVTNLAEAMLTQVEAMGPITTDAEDEAQKEMQAGIKQALKDWEAERKGLTDPLNGVIKSIIDKYRTAAAPATKALEVLNDRIKKRWLEKKATADKEQRRQNALAQKRLETATKRAEDKGEEAPEPIIPLPSVAAPAKTVQTAQGKVTVSQYWTWRYATDETDAVKAAVEAGRLDLLQFNEKAAGAAVRAGVRSVPGLVVYQDVKV